MSDLPVLTRTADEEIDQLQARVQELEKAVSSLRQPHMDFIPTLNCTGEELLNRTPAQSLKRHDAEVLRRVADQCDRGDVGDDEGWHSVTVEWLRAEADRLIQGEGEGND